MTRGEREILIERYLNGEMTSAQEQDFFIQVAVDKELRQELKAYRTVESAFRKDREAERSEHTALRSRVSAMLPLYPSPGDPVPVGTPQSSGETVSTVGPVSRFMNGSAKWFAASGVAVLLAVGAYLFSVPSPAPAPAQQVAAPTATPKAVATPALPAPRQAATGRSTMESTDGQTPVSDETKPAHHAQQRRTSDEPSERTASATEHSASAPAQASPVTPKPSERHRGDTANVGLRIEFPSK